jgi:hypothetical protein
MLFGVLLLLVLSIGVVGAQDNQEAQLRAVHAAPDVGEVDVYVDGELAIEGLAYTDATDFQALGEGDFQIQVTAAGDDVENAVLDTSLTLDQGEMVTLVVYGSGTDVDFFTYEHDWDDPENDQARIVLVNATSDEADVELQYNDESFGDGLLDFGNTSTETVDAGDYNFEVVSGDQTVTTIDGFNVSAGQTYSVFVMGTEGAYEAVTYEDMAAVGPGPDVTPETTPDTDATPEATPDTDATPATTPDTDATPEATPDTDATPATTPDTDATPATTPDTDATPATTPGTGEGAPGPSPTPAAPALPETGAGGTAGDAGSSGWLALAIAAFAVALGGGLIWRTRNERTTA